MSATTPATTPASTASTRGIRHAAILTSCLVVPISYAVGAATTTRVEGFPVWTVVLLMAVVGVGSGLLGVDASRSRGSVTHGRAAAIAVVVSRLIGAAVVAMAVRMTVPSPSGALEEIREGDAYLVSGTALVVFALLIVSASAGHLITTRIVTIARGQTTTLAARADDQQVLVSVWGTGLVLLIVVGLTHRSAGTMGQALAVAGVIGALLTVADLRGRIPPPGGSRAPLVAVPRKVQLGGTGMALLAVVVATAVVVPLLPAALSEGLGRPSEWLEDARFELQPERARPTGDDGARAQTRGREDLQPRRIPWLPDPNAWEVAPWVQALVIGGLVLVLLLVLRPERWLATVRRLVRALFGGRWDEDAGAFDRLSPLEEVEDDGSGRGGRFRDVFERVRPRPRDPRQAIVHDYLRVERALGRDDDGRRPSETPLEHAARLLGEQRGVDLGPLVELAGLATTARYAATSPSLEASERSRELQQLLDRELRARR